jgi:hypothetical protein
MTCTPTLKTEVRKGEEVGVPLYPHLTPHPLAPPLGGHRVRKWGTPVRTSENAGAGSKLVPMPANVEGAYVAGEAFAFSLICPSTSRASFCLDAKQPHGPHQSECSLRFGHRRGAMSPVGAPNGLAPSSSRSAIQVERSILAIWQLQPCPTDARFHNGPSDQFPEYPLQKRMVLRLPAILGSHRHILRYPHRKQPREHTSSTSQRPWPTSKAQMANRNDRIVAIGNAEVQP